MKKLFLILLSVLIFPVILLGCSSNEKKIVKEKNTVIVGIDDTFVPMGFRDKNGNIVGFDVDLAKEAFHRMGFNVKFQPIDWSMKETELNNRNIDVIWNGYTMTSERAKKVAFSNPYLKNRQVIVTLDSSDINSLNDLKGKEVSTQDGSSSLDVLFDNPKLVSSFKDKEPILFDSFNDCFMDLEAKRSDAVVCDEILAQYYMAKRAKVPFKILKEDLGKESYCVGLRKNSSLLSPLNKTLEEMKKDGTIKKISIKWFGKDLEN